MMKTARILFVLSGLVMLGACTTMPGEAKYPSGYDRPDTNGDIYAKPDSVFGKGGLCCRPESFLYNL